MSPKTHLRPAAAALGIVRAPAIAVAQLQTEAPAPVAGAKPVTVEWSNEIHVPRTLEGA